MFCPLAFISWTKKELEDYAEIFRKQVYTKDVDPKVVAEAISTTLVQSRKVHYYTSRSLHIFTFTDSSFKSMALTSDTYWTISCPSTRRNKLRLPRPSPSRAIGSRTLLRRHLSH